ncbi:MAG: PilZ domain-containing protein [Sphingomonadales bacterium]|nr:PilZ domain-containing protein [Sphingomonadales bacterium]
MARLATDIDAGLVLPDRRVSCIVENISRTGCRLQVTDPPRVGATALVRVERIEALGTVAWVRGERCGVKFQSSLSVGEVERIRWIVEHAREHENSSLAHATAVWR